MWGVITALLFSLLWQINDDARIINYSGLVRGVTQRAVKDELYGNNDDQLIDYLDDLIYDLEHGGGIYGLSHMDNDEFYILLDELDIIWSDIKDEIILYRAGADNEATLYELSEEHFFLADDLVTIAEEDASNKTQEIISFYIIGIIFLLLTYLYFHKRTLSETEKSIYTDKLTGLYSRIGFEKEASSMLSFYPEKTFIIIKFDIENFKLINNVYTHSEGDKLLCSISTELTNFQETKLLCSRTDADYFLILMEEIPNLEQVLKNHLENATTFFDFSELFAELKYRFGAYKIQDNADMIKSNIDKANIAHRTAKEQSGEGFTWYDEEFLKKSTRENYYTEQLEPALKKRDLKMYLQPQINLKTMEIESAESLVRWELPDGTFVYPDFFIPLFEKNGLISKLDFYILEQACIYLQEQYKQGAPLFTIAVNFSRVTLFHSKFYERFTQIVNSYEIPHEYIELEVTETSLNKLGASIIDILTQLREDGFKLAMDDFGAGYSSLSFLSILPVHFIKLDRQFLWGIDTNERMKLIIISSVNLAHRIGLSVVCEGVETQGHVDFLREIGCDYAQGYFFTKPMTSHQFSETVTLYKNIE